jgi:hypothetical protein
VSVERIVLQVTLAVQLCLADERAARGELAASAAEHGLAAVLGADLALDTGEFLFSVGAQLDVAAEPLAEGSMAQSAGAAGRTRTAPRPAAS